MYGLRTGVLKNCVTFVSYPIVNLLKTGGIDKGKTREHVIFHSGDDELALGSFRFDDASWLQNETPSAEVP